MTDPSFPLYSGASPAEVARDLANLVDFQQEGLSVDELNQMIHEDLLPHLMRYDLPRFQSMFNAFPSDMAKLGAQVMLAFNQGITNWQVSPGGAMLEELCVQALCRLFNLGPNADATFMYSGTYGNQQALYLALHRHAEKQGFNLARKGVSGFADPQRLAVLAAEDAHFSIKHAVRLLGLGEDSLILLPVDSQGHIDITAAEAEVAALRSQREIVGLVGTAGKTATGAIDPLDPLADLCAKIGAWFHVDGAYGYAYKLVPEWAHLFTGDDRADSISWDPHKQLSAPIPSSVLFVKERSDFQRMALYSHYFNQEGATEPNPGLKSPPSTRPMSALPLVTIIRGKGLKRLVDELRRPLTAVRSLAEHIGNLPDVDIVHQPETGILCFRITPPGLNEEELDNLQFKLYQAVMSRGQRSISTTKISGRQVLRLVVVSPETTFPDLRETVDAIRNDYLGMT